MTTVANTAVADTSRENYVARWRALKDQYAVYQEQINALERPANIIQIFLSNTEMAQRTSSKSNPKEN